MSRLLLLFAVACAGSAPSRRIQYTEPSAVDPAEASLPAPMAGPWWEQRGVWKGSGPLSTPAEHFRAPTAGPLRFPLSTDGTRIYAVSAGKVQAFEKDGFLRWSRDVQAISPARPTEAGVAVGQESGPVLILNPARGVDRQVWPAEAPIVGGVGALEGELVWSTADRHMRAQTGWSVDLGGDPSGEPCSYGRYAVVLTAQGELIGVQQGRIAWKSPLPGPGIFRCATDGSVVVAAWLGPAGVGAGVGLFRLTDGQRLWSTLIDGRLAGPPVLGDRVYVAEAGGLVRALEREGGEDAWQSHLAGGLSAAPAITEHGLYAGGSDGRVYRLDLADGGEVWQVEVGAAVTADPVIVDDMLVLGLSNGDVVGLMARQR